ncbi:hypothetical protein [Tautonia plasticadhaerens]|uniref:Uncharacterized protein n=1 Tax=Tautonia plasticadhaerens TaxID=2527974 RepID=A0A518H2V8_9BACT|nr:hypothetical protein [Tautonia plasticadhaerens]QDV35171.1 hypothetical protein ElP_30740 [Tautonia plasticadhaerens]
MNDPREFQYVILDYNGVSWLVRDNATERGPGLPSLLADGWKPVRETPFHSESSVTPYVLILLERDHKDRGSGFGFA